MSRATDALGVRGEDLAVELLTARGYRILARRLRTRYGEIDILADYDRTLIVVEVKTRSGRGFGSPAEGILSRQSERLRRIALGLGGMKRAWRERPIRIDVIEVTRSGESFELNHIEDAIGLAD